MSPILNEVKGVCQELNLYISRNHIVGLGQMIRAMLA